MKKLLLVPVAAAMFLVSCKSKSTTTTSNKGTAPTTRPLITKERLAEGKTLFEERCQKCHALPNPAKYSDTKWIGIMNAMAPKAKLDEAQGEIVYDYVTSRN